MKGVLFITEEFDLEADAIILELRKRGHMPDRLIFPDLPTRSRFSLRLGNAGKTGFLNTRNSKLYLSDIVAVYYGKIADRRHFLHLEEESDRMAFAETARAANALWQTLDCHWINVPSRVEESANRMVQLEAARRAGLAVPATLITSEVAEAEAFLEEFGGVAVLKTIGRSALPFSAVRPDAVAVRRIRAGVVRRENLCQPGYGIEAAPCLFQELIEKRLAMQVVVVGPRTLAFEVSGALIDDGRGGGGRPIFTRPVALPSEVAAQCVSVARALGLAYCQIDLAVGVDGRPVFLGCDAVGGWVESAGSIMGREIVDAVASQLERELVTK